MNSISNKGITSCCDNACFFSINTLQLNKRIDCNPRKRKAFILMMFIGDLVSIPTIAFGIGGFIIIASLINNKILSRTQFENEQQRSEVTSTS